jgi:hypothetical protein
VNVFGRRAADLPRLADDHLARGFLERNGRLTVVVQREPPAG